MIDDFIDKLERVKPYLIPKDARRLEEGEYLQTPAQLKRYKQFTLCINCMLCYAACPEYGLIPNSSVPAAIALAHRYNQDSRDGGRDARRRRSRPPRASGNCSARRRCSEVCPEHVDPANAVNQNKTKSALDFFLRFVGRPAHSRTRTWEGGAP